MLEDEEAYLDSKGSHLGGEGSHLGGEGAHRHDGHHPFEVDGGISDISRANATSADPSNRGYAGSATPDGLMMDMMGEKPGPQPSTSKP